MELLRPYVSVSEMQAFLDNRDGGEEERIKEAINQASRYIEDRCRRDFWFHDHTTTAHTVKRGDICGQVCLLPFEILTLTEVKVDDTVLTEGLAEDDYWYESGSRIIRCTDTSWGDEPFRQTLTVKGTFGYALDAESPLELPPPLLPGGLKEAAKQIAAAMSGLWKKTRMGLEGTESFTQTTIPAGVAGMLKQFTILSRTIL